MIRRLAALNIILFLFLACTFSDDERCADGFVFYKPYWGCLPADGGNDQDASTDQETDFPTDQEKDGGDDSGTTTTGLGESCTKEGDCANYQANYCVINPLEPGEPGYCTYSNCKPQSCPVSYQCCDCSAFGFWIACVTSADAEEAKKYCVCS